MARIHFVVSEVAKTHYRTLAQREGKSLGQWMREAAEAKVAAEPRPRLFTVEELERFYADCDARRGPGREPDWEEVKELINSRFDRPEVP